MQYKSLAESQYYIDKTEALEKGITVFPSIYIEGAAACGKTTAVKMLLARHPEVKPIVFDMETEGQKPERFREKLQKAVLKNLIPESNALEKAVSKSDALEKNGLESVFLEKKMLLSEENGYPKSERKATWVILENIRKELSHDTVHVIAEFIRNRPSHCRMILVGRERPQEELLEFFWKREMELLPQKVLLFTRQEVRELAAQTGSELNPDQIYHETGGWAGCVDMMLRLSAMEQNFRKDSGRSKSVFTPQQLRQSYEIDTYIRKTILNSLSSKEQEIMRRAAICPWLNAGLCEEVWGMYGAAETLERLERKGLMILDSGRKHWRMAPLFRRSYQNLSKEDTQQISEFWKKLGQWYEEHDCVQEALLCLKHLGNEKEYRACMAAHYNQIPFPDIPCDEVMEWKENLPEICYLRGMYCYFHRNQEGLDREIRKLEKELEKGLEGELKKEPETENRMTRMKEIYLNLTYVKPDLPLNQWLELLEKYAGKQAISGQTASTGSNQPKNQPAIRLYHMLGGSCTFLCGLRDLSGLFACTKKEENRKARIWKECLGPEEWQCYQLARMDYYLETGRKESIREEDQALLEEKEGTKSWQFQLAALYLLCKLQRIQPAAEYEEYEERIARLEKLLIQEENTVCVRNTEAITCIHSVDAGEPEKLVRWLRSFAADTTEVREDNYTMLYCQAKGYMLLNQYERASKILRRLIPYLQFYHRTRFLAELLFQQAAAGWEEDRHGQSLKSAIESFLVNGSCRYVGFYTEYGTRGKDVLEAYVEWMKNNTPGGWHRKKKYNYGNVLRMPLEDYMEVILRCARREARTDRALQDEPAGERLTMMETIILQDIGHGLSNTEISKELNLKITTVKSHIYSLYKKLGVNSRVQAILKGKELGVLK